MAFEGYFDNLEPSEIAQIVKDDIEHSFRASVQDSEEIKSTLQRIKVAGNKVPRARGVVHVGTVEDWFDIYRKHLLWHDDILESNLISLLNSEDKNSLTSKKITSSLRSSFSKIVISPGLVELKLSSSALERVNISKHLVNTERLIGILTELLMKHFEAALAQGVSWYINAFLPEEQQESERQLNDDTGSVVFRADDGFLEITSGPASERSDIRVLVSDALADLLEPSLISSAEQRNKRTGILARSYKENFDSSLPDNDLLLYSIGVKLFTALGSFENPSYEDERPPQEFIDALKTLLIHHESYVWTFPRIKELIEHRRKILESYGVTATDRVRIESNILRELAKAEHIIGIRSRTAISNIEESVGALSTTGSGPEAFQHGLLRGALQLMGRIVVQAQKTTTRVAGLAATLVSSKALAAAIIASPLYQPIVSFFQSQITGLLELVASAEDWNWLRLVINFIHKI